MISRLVGMFRRDPQLGGGAVRRRRDRLSEPVADLDAVSTAAFAASRSACPANSPWRTTSAPTPIRSPISCCSIRLFSPAVQPLLATALAATLAWISIRTNAPFRKFFEITAIVPNIFPPVMLAVSWTVLLSPRTGLINRLLMADLRSVRSAVQSLFALGHGFRREL